MKKYLFLFLIIIGLSNCGTDSSSNSTSTLTIETGIAVRTDSTCALLSTGAVRCWGDGGSGRLGHNSEDDIGDGVGISIIAAGDVPVGASVARIVVGDAFACALLVNKNVRCWGFGNNGRLGNNSTNRIGDGSGLSIIAAGDVPIGETVNQLSAGQSHVCALLSTGNMRCWGYGGSGQLGYGNASNVGDGGTSIIAAGDIPVGGTITQIAAGGQHNCALLDTGAVRCWGEGASGRLGYGNTDIVGAGGTSIVTAGDIPVGGTVTQISAGSFHTCALLSTGNVRCWGTGSSGQLGHDSTANIGDGVGDSIITAGDISVGGTVTQISAGGFHTCALLTTGAVRCWGLGSSGELGNLATTNIGDDGTPTIVGQGDLAIGETVTKLSAGIAYNCAYLSTGNVRCWGSGSLGVLGHGSTVNIGDGAGLSITAAGDVPIL